MTDPAQNSLLTDKQREYLRSSDAERKEEYTKQLRSYHRKNIRERLQRGVADITLILDELPLEDLKTVVEPDPELTASEENIHFSSADLVTLAFLLEEYLSDQVPNIQDQERHRGSALMIHAGIIEALRMLGQSWQNIEVTIERGDTLDELAQKDLSELSNDELDQLYSDDRISREEYARAILG